MDLFDETRCFFHIRNSPLNNCYNIFLTPFYLLYVLLCLFSPLSLFYKGAFFVHYKLTPFFLPYDVIISSLEYIIYSFSKRFGHQEEKLGMVFFTLIHFSPSPISFFLVFSSIILLTNRSSSSIFFAFCFSS